MATMLQRIAKGVGQAAGVDISFENGVANVNLNDSQVAAAQNVIRNILKSTDTSGKSTLNVKRSWDIVGIPVLETYGMFIGLGFGSVVAIGMLLGYYLGKRNR
jgi:hypothetical protein